MVGRVDRCSVALESAGEALMKRQSVPTVGKLLLAAGEELTGLSTLLSELSVESVGKDAAQRCSYAAEQMILAGNNLLPAANKPKPTGKSWLKGGAA